MLRQMWDELEKAATSAFLPEGETVAPDFEVLVIEGLGRTTVAVKSSNGKAYRYPIENSAGLDVSYRLTRRGGIVTIANAKVIVRVERKTKPVNAKVKIEVRSCIGHVHVNVYVPMGAVVSQQHISARLAGRSPSESPFGGFAPFFSPEELDDLLGAIGGSYRTTDDERRDRTNGNGRPTTRQDENPADRHRAASAAGAPSNNNV